MNALHPLGVSTVDVRGQVMARAGRDDYWPWLAHVASAAGCTRPVRLAGTMHHVEAATGRILEHRHTVRHARRGPLHALRQPPRLASARPAPRPTGATPTSSSAPASSAAKASPTPSPPIRPCSPPSPHPRFGPSTPGPCQAHLRKRRRCDCRPGPATPAAKPSARTGSRLICSARHDRDDPPPRPAALPGLLRPRPPRRLERPGRRTVAPHHLDHPRPPPSRPTRGIDPGQAARCPTARSPRYNAAASSTSTPSSASTPATPPTRTRYSPHRPESGAATWSTPSTTPPRTARSPPTPTRPIRPGHRLGPASSTSAHHQPRHRRRRSPTAGRRLPGQVRHQSHRTHRPHLTGVTGETDDVYSDPDGTHLERLIDACWTLGGPAEWRPPPPLGAHARLRRPLPHQIRRYSATFQLLRDRRAPAQQPHRLTSHRRLDDSPTPADSPP